VLALFGAKVEQATANELGSAGLDREEEEGPPQDSRWNPADAREHEEDEEEKAGVHYIGDALFNDVRLRGRWEGDDKGLRARSKGRKRGLRAKRDETC